MQFSTKLPPQGRGMSVSVSRSRASSLTPPGTPGDRSPNNTTPMVDRVSPTRAGELWMIENAKTARSMRRFPYMMRGVASGATPNDVRNFLSKVGPVKEMYLPVHHLERTPRQVQPF